MQGDSIGALFLELKSRYSELPSSRHEFLLQLMRDLLIYALLGGGALYALKAPWIGAVLWALLSLMSPHVEFGWTTYNKPFAMVVAITTLLGFAFTRERQNPFLHPIVGVMLAFVIWTCITLPFSIYFEPSYVLWLRSIKIFFMLFITLALLTTKERLDVFIWVCVVSIGWFGFKGGLFTLATGGNYRVWGPGGFIGGNNELAVAIIITIPLLRYLQQQIKNQWISLFMWFWIGLCAVSAVGSHSRGALLGIVAMALALWWKGNRKVLFGSMLVLSAVVALPFMPEHWWDRMETIRTYEQDASAAGRINAWYAAFNLANDRFLGGGFMIYRPDVFAKYAPIPDLHLAAHSIYFQVLGEHGWIGLLLYLATFAGTYFAAAKLVRTVEAHRTSVPDIQWAADLAKMIQVALIGFGVGGAFLSLAYYDMPYNMVAMVALASWFVKQRIDTAGREAKSTVAAGGGVS